MENTKYIIIHYAEIALKKGNRGFFEQQLQKNIRLALADVPIRDIRMDFGRFVMSVDINVADELLIERLKNVMGIAYFSIAWPGDWNIDTLAQQVYDRLQHVPFSSFKIHTKRADKSYPLTSVDVNKQVGAKIFMEMDKKVDLKNPELTCTIEIFNGKIFFFHTRIEGQRGLPVGSSGKVVCLLSSGIDSPVAAYRMMTRGCKIIFVHFHSFPFTDKNSYHNSISLAQQLTRFQYNSKVYLVPLAEIQQAIIETAPPKLRLLLYRRMMYRLAEWIARKEKAKALITGESVGQVASQTLENMTATAEVVQMPILRPLVGMDKEEIVDQAKEIDTFTTSIEPYNDCCSFLVPKSPETKAKLPQVHAAENRIENLDELLKKAISNAELKKLGFPARE